MATFSQQFLANLGRPAMGESLFGLGRAIGGVPGQIQQRKKQEEFNKLIQQAQGAQGAGDFASMKIVSQQLSAAGFPEQAGKIMQSAVNLEKQGQKQQGEAAAIQTELQNIIQSSDASPQLKKTAINTLRGFVGGQMQITDTLREQMKALRAASTAPAGQNYVVVGNRVFNRNTGEFISAAETAEELKISDLKDIFTPESISEYLKTGDRDDLQTIVGEGEKTQQQYVAALKEIDSKIETADKALGLTDDYFPLTYDITKYLPLTDSRQLRTYVNTLQSNLAFDRLQKMRDESKTGGALGQVSNIELDLLKSSVATLDPGSANFAEQLQVVRRSYQDFKNALLGKAPSGERYITKDGVLYYELDDGTYENLTERARVEQAANMGVR